MNRISLQVPDSIELEDTDSDVLVLDDDNGNTEDYDTVVNTSDADGDDEEGGDSSDRTTTSGRPGIDEILSNIRETQGEHAEGVIRALMREDTQVRQLDADRRRLREALDEVEELKESLEGEAYPDPDEEALSQVPPEQLQLLESWMESQGYIKQSDLTELDKEAWVADSNRAGVDLFGEDFGWMDGDEFVLNEDAQEAMAPVYERVVDQQNLDYRDLFILGNFPTLIESAMTQGRNEAIEEIRSKNGHRVSQAQRGSVAVSNAGGTAKSSLYNREDYNDRGGNKASGFRKISDVLQKARRAAQSA